MYLAYCWGNDVQGPPMRTSSALDVPLLDRSPTSSILVENDVNAVTLAGGQERRKDAVILCRQRSNTTRPRHLYNGHSIHNVFCVLRRCLRDGIDYLPYDVS